MMSDTYCGYDGQRGEIIVAYVYGELAAGERTAFTRHLTRCLVCRREIEALGDLRVELAEWSPPNSGSGVAGDIVARGPGAAIGSLGSNNVGNNVGSDAGPVAGNVVGSIVPSRPAGSERSLRAVDMVDRALPPVGPTHRQASGRPAWQTLPIWAQFAAAILVLGVSAGIANLQVTYNRTGLMVRTGWSGTMAQSAASAPAAPAADAADLAVLSEQVRSELRRDLQADLEAAMAAATPVPAAAKSSKSDQDELVARVRALLRESEQRQQRELALRVGEVAQDVQAQRQADLVRMDRTLGALQNTTGTAVRRQEQLLNNLAVRVSQRQ